MQEIEHLVHSKLLLILILAVLVKAELPAKLEYTAKVYSGVSNMLNENYDAAKRDFKFFREKNPNSPLGGILYAGALILQREHAENYIGAKEIDSLLYVSQDSCEALLNRFPDDLWANYLMALTKTYQTYWKLFETNYLDGFADGFIALQYFEKCLSIDSTFAEAKAAIGNYNYWSSVKTKSLQWLPFIEDKRQTGLQYLETALTEKFLNRDFTLISLGYAYLEEERFLAAVKVAKELVNKYPNSNRIKALLASAYKSIEPESAIRVYKELIKNYTKAGFDNPFKVIEVKNDLANLYFETGEYQKADKLCDEVLKMPEINALYQVQIIPLIEELVELKDSTIAHLNNVPKK